MTSLRINFKSNISVTKEFSKYLAYSLLSTIISFIKLLIFAKLLGPTLFATFSFFEIIAAYGLYSGTLGIFDSASRLIPFYLGKQKTVYSRILVSFSIGGQIMLSVAIFVIYLAVVFMLPSSLLGTNSKFIFFLAGVYAFFSNMFNMCLMIVIAQGNKSKYALYLLIKNSFSLIFGYLLADQLKVAGVISVEIIVSFSIVIYILSNRAFIQRIRFSIKQTKKFIINGFPFMLNNLLQNFSRNSERLIIGFSLGMQAFGQFSFATVIFTIGVAIQNVVSQYLTPIICFDYGRSHSVSKWLVNIDKVFLIWTLFSLLTYPLYSFIVDEIGVRYYSQFSIGLSLIKILYFGAIFHLGNVYQGVLIALNKSILLTLQAGIILVLSIILCLVGFYSKASPEYYAFVFVINRLIGVILIRAFCK